MSAPELPVSPDHAYQNINGPEATTEGLCSYAPPAEWPDVGRLCLQRREAHPVSPEGGEGATCGKWALDGSGISCDLAQGHTGPHYDREEGDYFELTVDMDPSGGEGAKVERWHVESKRSSAYDGMTDYGVFDSDGYMVSIPTPTEERARLIAAAPELLAELIEAHAIIRKLCEGAIRYFPVYDPAMSVDVRAPEREGLLGRLTPTYGEWRK